MGLSISEPSRFIRWVSEDQVREAGASSTQRAPPKTKTPTARRLTDQPQRAVRVDQYARSRRATFLPLTQHTNTWLWILRLLEEKCILGILVWLFQNHRPRQRRFCISCQSPPCERTMPVRRFW